MTYDPLKLVYVSECGPDLDINSWILPSLPVYGNVFYEVCCLGVADDDAFR